jgi:hypothetical protein
LGIWIDDHRTPAWVEAEMAVMAPGTVQLNIFAWNKKLAKYVKAGEPEKTLQLFQQSQQ